MANPSPNPSQPASPAAASIQPYGPETNSSLIPLDSILESKTNPRRTRNPKADQELAESVRVHGVLQPVLVRKNGGDKYELVVGSRRFRAAQAAGRKTIPATIRELTDEQAMELQIVENLQREDVAPLEEGQGYKQLIAALGKKDPKRAADGQGVGRQDLVAEIAKKVGKSPRYVYARMKLCELLPELQKDLEEGRIEASHADELVRLTPKDQRDIRAGGLFMDERQQGVDEEAELSSWKQGMGERAISVRNLKVIIERDYQLTLDKAKFDIKSAELKPLPCVVCPKNTGFNPLLPPAAKPTCTDKECWRNKMRQHVEMQASALAKKASSPKLVQVALAHYDGYAGVIGRDGWRAAKPGECKNVVAASQVDVGGGVKHFQSAKTVCTNKQCKKHFAPAPAKSRSSGGSSSPAPKANLEDLRKHHERGVEMFLGDKVPVEFLRRVLAKVEKLGEPEMRLMAEALGKQGWFDHAEFAFILGREKADPRGLAKSKASELPRALMALVFGGEGTESALESLGPYGKSRGVDRGVDASKLEAELVAKLKRCQICGCFDQHGCDLGGGKRCSWVKPTPAGVKTQVCTNPLCVAEAARRTQSPSRSPAAAAKKPAQTSAKARPAKKAKGGRR